MLAEILTVIASLIVILALWHNLTTTILDTAHHYFEVKNNLGFLLLGIVFIYMIFVIRLLTFPSKWNYTLIWSIAVYILFIIIDIVIGVHAECKRRFS